MPPFPSHASQAQTCAGAESQVGRTRAAASIIASWFPIRRVAAVPSRAAAPAASATQRRLSGPRSTRSPRKVRWGSCAPAACGARVPKRASSWSAQPWMSPTTNSERPCGRFMRGSARQSPSQTETVSLESHVIVLEIPRIRCFGGFMPRPRLEAHLRRVRDAQADHRDGVQVHRPPPSRAGT